MHDACSVWGNTADSTALSLSQCRGGHLCSRLPPCVEHHLARWPSWPTPRGAHRRPPGGTLTRASWESAGMSGAVVTADGGLAQPGGGQGKGAAWAKLGAILRF